MFPPARQHGEFAIDGQTSTVDHEYWPYWIGKADAGPDIGYSRNGQMQTVTWNITREINRPAWYGVLGVIGVIWMLGLAKPRRKAPAPISRYPQEIIPKAPAAPQAPQWAEDREQQHPPRRQSPIFPGVSVPGDMGSVRRQPPPGGRYR